MPIETFNDGEIQSSIRAKLNETITEVNELVVGSYDYIATDDQASGNVTSQSFNGITDSTKSWATDQFVGSVVLMTTADGAEDCGIVLNNNATSIILDDNHAGYTFATYRILSTFTAPRLNSIYSFDIRTNDCGFVMPSVSSQDDRDFLRVYCEKATGDSRKVLIVCSGADRQRTFKYGFLENQYESVHFFVHKVTPNHWDIFSIDGVKRYGTLSLTANQSLASATYSNIMAFSGSDATSLRRFELLNRTSVAWLKYKSISVLRFHVSGSVIVTRSGGGSSIVEVAVRIKRFVGGAIEDSTKHAKIRFSGDSTQTVALDVDIELHPCDEVTIVAKRDAGTVVIEADTNVVFTEM